MIVSVSNLPPVEPYCIIIPDDDDQNRHVRFWSLVFSESFVEIEILNRIDAFPQHSIGQKATSKRTREDSHMLTEVLCYFGTCGILMLVTGGIVLGVRDEVDPASYFRNLWRKSRRETGRG